MKNLTNDEINKIKEELSTVFKNWLDLQIFLIKYTTDLKELNFLKARVDTEDGGLYFWSFIHVDGKKIELPKDKDE